MAATEQTLWTAVLFDFDGTLGDSIDLIISSLRATAAELPGYTVDEAAIRPWIGRPLTAMLVEQGVTDHAEWMNVYRRHYRRAHDQLLRPMIVIAPMLRATGHHDPVPQLGKYALGKPATERVTADIPGRVSRPAQVVKVRMPAQLRPRSPATPK